MLSSSIIAAEHGGAHHEPHVKELMWPIFNFILFFGFIIYKAKKPIKEGFDKNAQLVKELFEYAKSKDEDAEKKISMYKDKLGNFHLEQERLNKEMKEEVSLFEKEAIEETKRQIEKAGVDAKRKTESEKNKKVKEINEELLNNIIFKTKETFGTNTSLREKATDKIVASL
jgi:F-type H+-transporting ATPase subunit b